MFHNLRNMTIENKLKSLSIHLSNINSVIGPNNLNLSSLAIISSELDALEKSGENVLALRYDYVLILGKVRNYQARKYI